MGPTHPTPLSVNGSNQPRWTRRVKLPTPRFRRFEKYTRDQGCAEHLNRELGQIFQPAVPEYGFQHDTGILNQPMLEITAFTPTTTGPG